MKSNPSSQQIEQLALRQLRDYQSNTPGMCFSEPDFNINVSAAYDLQDAVTRLRVKAGENVIGYKVGCTGPGTKAQFGMNGPIRGTLFGNEAFRNDAVINPNEFCQLAIEGEMAVKVDEDGQIKAAFPVIELHNFLFGAEPCKVGSKYTCDQLDRAKYNVYFYTPEDQEKYLGVAINLASARIMSVQYANQLGLKRDAGWQTVFCLKTNNSECEEKH